jgi:NAD(P)H-hydrate epimerase
MKILNAGQIREADAFTIKQEPIASIDLMERAANQCTQWIKSTYSADTKVIIVAGMGNNGGDGLAMARQLSQDGYQVVTYIAQWTETGSHDFEKNHIRLLAEGITINQIGPDDAIEIESADILVDAIFGSGLSRPVEGFLSPHQRI